MPKTTTDLQPSVLKWAREKASLTVEELAKKLQVPPASVLQWETDGRIPMSKIAPLAASTNLAFGYLMLPSPPNEVVPIADYRTIGNYRRNNPSGELLDVLYQSQLRQDWFRNYVIEGGGEKLPFVGSVDIGTPYKETARMIARTLNIGSTLNSKCKDWEEAFRRTIERIESGRILVSKSGMALGNTRRTLKVEEFRGFALVDAYAPLVFVNNADASSAQMFTLMHEIVHVWIGQTSLNNLDATFAATDATEQYCNQVAAEVLIPEQEMSARWDRHQGKHQLSTLANFYKVSKIVTARRAKDLGLISWDEFMGIFQEETAATKKGKGGSYYRNAQVASGRRFAVAIIKDAKTGRTTYKDAMYLLNIPKIDNFRKFANSLSIDL